MLRKKMMQVGAADRLKAQLKKRAITVTQLADHLGISRQAIYGWFKRGAISPVFLDATATLLHVNASWLVFGEGQQQLDSETCHNDCPLKNKLIDMLQQSNSLIVEHNISLQTLQWHGDSTAIFDGHTAPTDSHAFLQWADESYRHIVHDALLSYHLYQSPSQVIFPAVRGAGDNNKKHWYEIQFHTHCNKTIVLYSLAVARMSATAGRIENIKKLA